MVLLHRTTVGAIARAVSLDTYSKSNLSLVLEREKIFYWWHER